MGQNEQKLVDNTSKSEAVKEDNSKIKVASVETIKEVPLATTVIEGIVEKIGNDSVNITKSLDVINIEDTKKKVSDIKVFGDGDLFKLIVKASSEEQGWMKSTKAMQIEGVGCVVQVSTQQKNSDGSYAVAESITFVPNVRIDTDGNGNRYLCKI